VRPPALRVRSPAGPAPLTNPRALRAAASSAATAAVAAAPAPALSVLGTALLLAPFFLWGTSMVCLKLVLPHTSPLFCAAVRLLPSGALLVAFAAARGRAQPSGAAAWAAVALFGLVDGTAFQGCLAQGLERTSAGLGSVIIDSQPLTVALLAATLFGERVSPLAAAGLLLGLLGLLVLELPAGPDGPAAALLAALLGVGAAVGDPAAGDASAAAAAAAPAVAAAAATGGLLPGGLWERGEWWMLLAAQAMAVGTVMVRGVVRLGVDPVMATGWHMVLGGAPLLALSLAREPELYASLAAGGLSGTDAALLGYASLFGGALAYAAFFNAAASGSLLRLSSLTFLTPVFAAAGGFVVLGETLTAQQLGGALITLAGIALVTVKPAPEPEPRP
jgi:drug/metabolite transporter (DMT)-like permease